MEDLPWLRRLDNGSTVALADVLSALRALDRGMDDEPIRSAPPPRAGRLAGILGRRPGLSIATERAP